MTVLEERLGAALAARALSVDEADLAPAQLPERAPRNRLLVALAAAACTALVIGVPYAISRLSGSEDPPLPPATAPPSPPPSPSADPESAGWISGGSTRADLDGDGDDEVVRLELAPVTGSPVRQARLEADLPGGTVRVLMPVRGSAHLERALDVDRSGTEEVLVADGTELEVFALTGSTLVHLSEPEEPLLAKRRDAEGRTVRWVAGDQGLFTIRSVGPEASAASPFPVERWRWTISGSALVPAQVDGGCATLRDPGDLVDCTPPTPTAFRPDELTTVAIGRTMPLDFEVDGHPATARLELDPGFAGDYAGDGDVELVVAAGPRTWRVDVPAGPLPELVREPLSTTGILGRGILLFRAGIEFEAYSAFGWVDDELVALRPPSHSPYLASSLGAGPQDLIGNETWVQGGWLYTAVAVGQGDAKDVYRWDRDGTTLRPTHLDRACVNLQNPASPC